ncbi:MAG: hypothetical protein WD696_11910 [Bryobacteraceae bacterium]
MLQPKISLTVGSKLYDRHALAFRLRRTQLPALDRLEVSLPAAVQFDAGPGEDCSLEIDGGDGAAVVFTGRISEVRRSAQSLDLTAHNGGLRLARFRPAGAFEKLTIGEVIENLCGEAGVSVGNVVSGPTLALRVTDGRATAAEEIAALALDAGAAGAFSGEDELYVTEEGGPAGEMALRYGRELLAIETGQVVDEYPRITVVGEGGGAPASAEGRWVIQTFLSGGPAPGFSDRVIARPEIRTTDDASAAAAALTHRRTSALTPVKLKLWLNPKIEPGMRLELADMPASLPLGECRVRQLVSTYVPNGAMTTEVWASGNTGGPADLLGELAGAIGGLL